MKYKLHCKQQAPIRAVQDSVTLYNAIQCTAVYRGNDKCTYIDYFMRDPKNMLNSKRSRDTFRLLVMNWDIENEMKSVPPSLSMREELILL